MYVPEKTLSSKNIFDGKIIKFYLDKISLINDKVATREVVKHNGGVCIAALTDENELLFVKQYRYPLKDFTLELPAGTIDDIYCNPQDEAIRELQEETGAIGKNYISLGKSYSSPGYCSEIIYLFLCKIDSFTKTSPDEDEFLEIFKIPIDEAYEMVLKNQISDSKTQIGILKAYYYLKNNLY